MAARDARDQRTLSERVGSTFENGFGDEGLLARGIHAVIMFILLIISSLIGLFLVPIWLFRRVFGIKTPDRGLPPAPRPNASE